MHTYIHTYIHTCTHIHTYIHIHIYLCNVGYSKEFNIEVKSTSQNLPYDYFSVMHHYHNSFSSSCRLSTMIPVNLSIAPECLGTSTVTTELDLLHINLLYCGGKYNPSIHTCTCIYTFINTAYA